jgi:lipopolysaccharide transport system permease protein
MSDEHQRTPVESVYDGARRPSLANAWRELSSYREVVWSFAVRGVRVRYKQAALGVGWAVLQPLAFLTIFILFFGRVVKVSGGGGATYAAFAISALVPWQFVASGVSFGANALVNDADLLRKVYFPRESPVLGAVLSVVPDLGIGLILVLLAAPFTHAHFSWTLVFLPILCLAIAIPTLAASLPLGAMNVYYRDFRYLLPFGIQLWLFASPIAYPVSEISPRLRPWYALVNPIVGPLEGFRRVLAVGTTPDWSLLAISVASGTVLLFAGYRWFKSLERDFADVV